MSLPPRAEIDPEYRFDLTRIYDDPAAWHRAADAFRERVADLETTARRDFDTPAALGSLLDATAACYRTRDSLRLYAALYGYVHTGDDAAADLRRANRDLDTVFDPAVATVCRRLAALNDERFEALVDALDEGRDDTTVVPTDYRPYAESLRRRGRHTREPAVEETVATVEEPLGAAERTIRAVTTEDLDPGTVDRPDGTEAELRIGNVQDELREPDRDYRRRVYETIRSELDRFEHTLTRAVGEKLKAARATATVRGYDSHRAASLAADSYPPTGVQSALPESVHDTLVEAVVAERDPYDRARRLRRDRLGVDTLRPWDTRVPLVDADPTPSYETATDHVLTALEPLGDDYVARVHEMLDERRVDVFPTANKRTDIPAACPASPADGPYVLANFREDVRTTFFLAHELGHAANVSYHTDGPTRYACNRVPVSEVPSLVHELLLADHLTTLGGPLADAARERRVELLGGNLYRNARSTAFGHRLAEIVADGEELTSDRARTANRQVAERFDPVVEPPADRDGRDWLGGGLRDAYTGHQYVLGVLGAVAAVEGLADGSLAPADYRTFLRHTGHDDALAAFERLGVDPTERSAYRRAAAAFDGAVDELARVTAE
ncbi:M3 family oligoendopeptidase [Halobaculum sp. MBLA0147]|uniref:M3 family oligoendopeptidase n=1 Tax=Halobaculum sp. MBLA0147 TaxID=3079934 RepID=UPI003524887C